MFDQGEDYYSITKHIRDLPFIHENLMITEIGTKDEKLSNVASSENNGLIDNEKEIHDNQIVAKAKPIAGNLSRSYRVKI